MSTPIENALLRYKQTYAWDKNLLGDTEEEILEIKEQAGLVLKTKEQILL